MAVNFGTYEGHRLLADAMNKSLDRVVDMHQHKQEVKLQEAKQDETKRQFQIQQENWNKQFAEKITNDKLLRRAKELDIERLNRESYLDNYMKDVGLKLYEDVNLNQPITVDDDGNLVVSDNVGDIIDNWMTKSNYGNIMDIANSMAGDYGNNKLGIEDIANLSKQTEDYVVHKLTDMKKMFSHLSADEIDDFMAKNPVLKDKLEEYYIDIGAPLTEDQTIGESFKTNKDDDKEEDLSQIFDISSGGWSGLDGDTQVFEGDNQGWGSSDIYFSGKTNVPTDRARKDANILLTALQNSKNLEVSGAGEGYWWADNADDLYLDYDPTNKKFTVTEDDSMFRGKNDVFDVKVENDTAYIYVNGKWQELGSYIDWD